MDDLQLVERKIKELNKYLTPSHQKLVLSEEKKTMFGETYYDLTWEREYLTETIEEHIFGGDEFEIFVTLNGLEYGIRMQQFKV